MTRLIVGISLISLLVTLSAAEVNAQNVAQVDGTQGGSVLSMVLWATFRA
jgi:hypothetical protein